MVIAQRTQELVTVLICASTDLVEKGGIGKAAEHGQKTVHFRVAHVPSGCAPHIVLIQTVEGFFEICERKIVDWGRIAAVNAAKRIKLFLLNADGIAVEQQVRQKQLKILGGNLCPTQEHTLNDRGMMLGTGRIEQGAGEPAVQRILNKIEIAEI